MPMPANATGFLKALELDNFKSYKGHHFIGPFKRFSSIIGPNGSGKSNLMDAICFVLGERTQNLRVKKLSELIHGAPINKPISNRAQVTAIYESNEGDETRFQRMIIGSSSEYRIDDRSVSHDEYAKHLESIGILIKSKNFLVFQGQVEQIAMKNAKERTAMFEEISRSIELKEEYEKAEAEVKKSEEKMAHNYHNKKHVMAEKKEARMEKDEADKYQRLRDELSRRHTEIQLLKLHQAEKQAKQVAEEIKSKVVAVEREKAKAETVGTELQEKRKEQSKLSKELNKLEQVVSSTENEIAKQQPAFIKAKESVVHTFQRLETAKKSLKLAERNHTQHVDEMRKLEDELNDVKGAMNRWEQEQTKASSKEGRDFHLEQSQLKEYNKLKDQASMKSSSFAQELRGVQREQKNDQDKLDSENRLLTEIENRIAQKQTEIESAKGRTEKLEEYIKTSETELAQLVARETELNADISDSKSRCDRIGTELEEVVASLGEASMDQNESSRKQRRRELIDTLSSHFNGVHGRLVDLCQPIHKRHDIAVTKVLGKYMEAIVVDTKDIAKDCIHYMKEQHLESETFLALDYLDIKQVDERLRNIEHPKGVKLVFDVIRCEDPAVTPALKFACGNSLVAETVTDAKNAAFSLRFWSSGASTMANDETYGEPQRQRVVALDGTLFEKSGAISGGSSELRAKARRWDEKKVTELRAKKTALRDELREAERYRRKEADLAQLASQIAGLRSRISYSKSDRDSVVDRQVKCVKDELKQLQIDKKDCMPRIKDIEARLVRRAKTLETLESRMNSVEDVVFGEFCSQLGIENIRQYEDSHLRAHQQIAEKRLQFREQVDRLSNQLEYEKTKTTAAIVKRHSDAIDKESKHLQQAQQDEKNVKGVIEKLLAKKTSTREQVTTLRMKLTEVESRNDEIKKRLVSAQKELSTQQKTLSSLENKLEQRYSDRHALLKTCKMSDVNIPLKSGLLSDVELVVEKDSTDMDTNSTGDVSSSVQTSDFDRHTSSSSQMVRERYQSEMARIEIDFSPLAASLLAIDGQDDFEQKLDELTAVLKDREAALSKIHAPNLRAEERLDTLHGRLKSTAEEFEAARRERKDCRARFENAKRERHDRFMTFFQVIADRIDDIYKHLTRNPAAQAILTAENSEEPYLDGIMFQCVAPGKRYRPMDALSGGEKTVAALSLLFAIHTFTPAPFFVMDEIDAALDNTNIAKVASFICEKSTRDFQVLVISHKEEFFSRSECLIGVCPGPGQVTISKTLTLDITEFADTAAKHQQLQDQRQQLDTMVAPNEVM